MEPTDPTDRAQQLAGSLLSGSLPRRWAHTIGVASTAGRFTVAVAPDCADRVVAAAWLHDIGYAADIANTGFHPLDGAAYLSREYASTFPAGVIELVAHHTGAIHEAAERGFDDELGEYRSPAATELAVLTAADLCTGPDGSPVDPRARLTEVLRRYPPDDPVHRTIARSSPALIEQIQPILEAAETAAGADPGNRR